MRYLSIAALSAVFVACGSESEPSSVQQQPTEARNASEKYISWKEHRIEDQGRAGKIELRGAVALAGGDFDGDGHPDFVTAFADSSALRIAYGAAKPDDWFRLGLAEGGEVKGLLDVAPGDVNGDGRADLVVAGANGLLYLQNPASEHRGFRWERVTIGADGGPWRSVAVADLEGDGRPEVLATARDGAVVAFAVDGDPLSAQSWQAIALGKGGEEFAARPADLDGDGDLDVFAGSVWLENAGAGEFLAHPVTLSDGRLQGEQAALTDLNGDGRVDAVIALEGDRIAWIEQPADPAQPWTTHAIGDLTPDGVGGLLLADIDQDGDLDVLAGSTGSGAAAAEGAEADPARPSGRVAWFQNPGDANSAWTRHDILRRADGRYAAWLAQDLDGDGDLDFVGVRADSGEYDGLLWLEQRHSGQPVPRLVPAREEESAALPLP